MIVYYCCNVVPNDVLDFLVQEDEYNPQDYIPDLDERKIILSNLVGNGQLAIIKCTDNVMILLRRLTSWVGIFDTKVRPNTSVKEVIRAYKDFFSWAKEYTAYYKLETRTPFEKYGRVMAKATGALLEGTRQHSYMDKERNMKTEYEYGYILERDQ